MSRLKWLLAACYGRGNVYHSPSEVTEQIRQQVETLSMHIRELEEQTTKAFVSRFADDPSPLVAPAREVELRAYTRRLESNRRALEILEQLRNMLRDVTLTDQVVNAKHAKLDDVMKLSDDIQELQQTHRNLVDAIRSAMPAHEEFAFEEEEEERGKEIESVPLVPTPVRKRVAQLA